MIDLDRITDPSFRAAVAALQRGDVAALDAMLEAEPHLALIAAEGPLLVDTAPPAHYFAHPKLLWFVANNPTAMETMPATIVDCTRAIIARGVAQADLDYTLELTMTSSAAHEAALQRPLIEVLLSAGATASAQTVLVTAAHSQIDALRALLGRGHAMTLPIAAAFGDGRVLPALVRGAPHREVQNAFGLAVINDHVAAAELLLDAGADVNARLPVHAHSTALHQAAVNDNPAMVERLVARGARLDAIDSLWNATPIEWAAHEGCDRARIALEHAAAQER